MAKRRRDNIEARCIVLIAIVALLEISGLIHGPFLVR